MTRLSRHVARLTTRARRQRNAEVTDLVGQWAIVTGASSGLGFALAEQLASLGIRVVMVALPGSGLATAAETLAHRYGVRTAYLALDLTAQGAPDALVQSLRAADIKPRLLLNNAGVGYNSRFEDSTLRANETCILLNNLATVKLTRLLLPVLQSQPSAHILNVASMAAFFPMPFMPVYAPSKAFVLNFGLALGQELRGGPVHVSTVCPNGIRTTVDAQAKIEAGGLAAKLTCLNPDEVARAALAGLFRHEDIIVPGGLNRTIVSLSRFAPRSLVYAVARAFWGRETQSRGQARGRRRDIEVPTHRLRPDTAI